MLNRALPVAAGALHVGPGSLAGWSIKETSGGAAGEIRIYDNAAAATGTIVAIIADLTSHFSQVGSATTMTIADPTSC